MLDVAMWRALIVFMYVSRSVSTICSRQLMPAIVAGLQLHKVLEDELCHHCALHPRPGDEHRRIRDRLDERARGLTFVPGRTYVVAGRAFGVRQMALRDPPSTTLFAFARWPELVAPHNTRSYFIPLLRRPSTGPQGRRPLASNRHMFRPLVPQHPLHARRL